LNQVARPCAQLSDFTWLRRASLSLAQNPHEHAHARRAEISGGYAFLLISRRTHCANDETMIAPANALVAAAAPPCHAGWLICTMDAHEGAGAWLAAAATFLAVVVSLWSSGEASRVARRQLRTFVARCDAAVGGVDWLVSGALDYKADKPRVLPMGFNGADQFADARAVLDIATEAWPSLELQATMRQFLASALLLGGTAAENTIVTSLTNEQASAAYRTILRDYRRRSDRVAERPLWARAWRAWQRAHGPKPAPPHFGAA
jgi:hypothetical protein